MSGQAISQEVAGIAVALARGEYVDERQIDPALWRGGHTREELYECVRMLRTHAPESQPRRVTVSFWEAIGILFGLLMAIVCAVSMGSDWCQAARDWTWQGKVLVGIAALIGSGVVVRWFPSILSDIWSVACFLVVGVMGPVLIVWGLVQACL
jgi:hypothetical protein